MKEVISKTRGNEDKINMVGGLSWEEMEEFKGTLELSSSGVLHWNPHLPGSGNAEGHP